MRSHLPHGPGQGKRPRAPRSRSRGQSLVEFALFVPVVVLVLLMALDFGRVFLGWVNINNMARIGANFASLNAESWRVVNNDPIEQRYRTLMQADATLAGCILPNPLPNPAFPTAGASQYSLGSPVEVDITCSFRLLTPFISALVGDGAGNLPVSASSTFIIRSGSVGGVAVGAPPPAPTPTPTPAPTPTPTPGPTPTPDPNATPTPTPDPVTVAFYGVPTSTDSSGGGPAGSNGEGQIIGIPNLVVSFRNETVGNAATCLWQFGDGTSSTSCNNTVSKTYSSRGTYDVTLTVNGQALERSDYVLVGCKVPDFHGVKKNSATATWTNAGFSAGNITLQPAGNGNASSNYTIGFQSLASGLVNPQGGCAGATIEVGE